MLIRPATPADARDIERLLDAAFGPGRHMRTATRLRVGATPLTGPSLVARDDEGRLLGSVQLWPIALVSDEERVPLVLLGPLAVAPSARSIGLGRRLLVAALTVADTLCLDPILLIGDLSYYGPSGFTADATGGWTMPGPVERERLLLRRVDRRCLPTIAAVVPATASSGAANTGLGDASTRDRRATIL